MTEKEPKKIIAWKCSYCGGPFWGWFFVILGGYFLLRAFNIVTVDIFWAIVFLLIGFYLFRRKEERK